MTNILNLNTVRARITARAAIIGFSAEPGNDGPIDPQRDKYNTGIFISEYRDALAARKVLGQANEPYEPSDDLHIFFPSLLAILSPSSTLPRIPRNRETFSRGNEHR